MEAITKTAIAMWTKVQEKTLPSHGGKLSPLQSIGIAYLVSVGSLVAHNLRWKYFLPTLLGQKARKLPLTKVKASGNIQYISIILLHGMWHDKSFYAELQEILSKRGYTSYSIDLLPGERFTPGGSKEEVVRDLEYTLEDIEGPYILIGHSQGGLVVQSALQRSEAIRKQVEGVVLLGSYPLGYTPPIWEILKEKENMYSDLGYLFICMFGKLLNVRYTKKIFLLPTTDEIMEETSSYIGKLLKAPSDGRITMTHFPDTPKPMDHIPALVLGAGEDILYPPHLLRKAFDERFPQATHKIVPKQAHCFRDEGWQESIAQPLLHWLDAQVPDVI